MVSAAELKSCFDKNWDHISTEMGQNGNRNLKKTPYKSKFRLCYQGIKAVNYILLDTEFPLTYTNTFIQKFTLPYRETSGRFLWFTSGLGSKEDANNAASVAQQR